MNLRYFLILVIWLGLSIVACNTLGDSSVTTEETPPVDETAEVSASTSEPTLAQTEEPTEVNNAIETEDPQLLVETDDPLLSNPSASVDGTYTIAVTAAQDRFLPPELPDAPSGFRWILIVATLANEQGDTVTVTQDTLRLVDETGEGYPPAAPDEFTNPAIVGAELAEGESISGLVRFAFPVDVEPNSLQWCPDPSCSDALNSPVP